MPGPYSVSQVADLLGLHVKTVRGYVRDGRLKAVRIGKQYRITQEDLEAFTGYPVEPPARETARRVRHVEVSSVVQVDAISPDAVRRLTNTLMAAAGSRPDGPDRLRVQLLYDEEQASLKIIVIGGLADSAELLRLVLALLKDGS
ncbi:MAG TPA: helix-turn-helix domain-containing protein [Actinomycetota bacterium]|jgi:excisionase family DNA binding protein|nr:helix-turn-helix domain-containing protein [Actinomycetota bacterium]